MMGDVVDAGTAQRAAVERYVDAFNRSDEEGLATCFTADGHILDGMAPHVWSGPDATRQWMKDATVEANHLGVSDFHMELGPTLHEAVTGDAAYFAAPATLSFKVHGQPITQSGAMFTLALRKVDDDWRIAAWAWTKGSGGGIEDVNRPAN